MTKIRILSAGVAALLSATALNALAAGTATAVKPAPMMEMAPAMEAPSARTGVETSAPAADAPALAEIAPVAQGIYGADAVLRQTLTEAIIRNGRRATGFEDLKYMALNAKTPKAKVAALNAAKAVAAVDAAKARGARAALAKASYLPILLNDLSIATQIESSNPEALIQLSNAAEMVAQNPSDVNGTLDVWATEKKAGKKYKLDATQVAQAMTPFMVFNTDYQQACNVAATKH